MQRIILLMLIFFSSRIFAQQVTTQDSAFKKYLSSDSLINLLQMNALKLDEVHIKGMKNYKADSLRRRREYASIFAYKRPSVMDAFIKKPSESSKRYSAFQNSTSSIASINVLQLFELLTKNRSSTAKLKNALLKEEEARLLDKTFSRDKIMSLTSLRGDSLEKFIYKYRPSATIAKVMNDYELLMYIKKSYAEFRKVK